MTLRLARAGILKMRRLARLDILPIVLLCICVARIWLMALPSSLWVDELVTVFVVRYPGHPSFAAAPQVPQSIYYWLPRASQAIFGSSEAALRLPSIVAMGIALFFIARLAARLIHPAAGWFAVFACIAFRAFDYFAVDARPYGLGIAVASASVWFLVRWLDHAAWLDETVFVILAGLLWRVHLFYWPFYLVYPIYTSIRLRRHDTSVSAVQLVAAVAALACTLTPVALTALRISRQADAHAFNGLPTLRNLFYLSHFLSILIFAAVAWILGRILRWVRPAPGPGQTASLALICLWWLVCPVCLFLYSRISGNGVLIMRYASLMLPGTALVSTAVVGQFIPSAKWRPAALCVGIIALGLSGDWTSVWPSHERDDWREAASLERSLARDDTPVICTSPFIEAQPPVWTPDYSFPGFLYSHLQYYTITGKPIFFPFGWSPEEERYLASLLAAKLLSSGQFVMYGSGRSLQPLDRWLAGRRELEGWRKESKKFDEISVTIYRSPVPLASNAPRVN
jgi:mannosyltransferase